MRYSALFQPIDIGRLHIKNRLVMAPIGTLFCASDGYVCDRVVEYYKARAKGGFGLIIVEGSIVDPLGKGGPRQLCIWDDSFISGFRRLVDCIHDNGAMAALQLMHAGRNSRPRFMAGNQPVAPSAVSDPVIQHVPKELTKEDISRLVESFAQAARRAVEAGFDAIEIHGGHGYLIAQFMSEYANRRKDEYGGSLEGFLRFPSEVVRRTRELVGQGYPILFRVSSEEAVPLGRTLEGSVAICKRLVEEGIDGIHITIGVYESSYLTMAPAAIEQGFNAKAASVFKSAISVPVIAVGRIVDPHVAEEIIASGKADLVAIGRQSLADPEWVKKVAENCADEIVKCLSCNEGCLAAGWKEVPIACIQNPGLGREEEYAFVGAQKPVNVLVAGGGPAGLESARTAALWGHKVTLFERETSLGGQAMIASIPPTKEVLKEVVLSRAKSLDRLGVETHLGEELSSEMVRRISPDVLIIATGSEPLLPDIPGITSNRVTTARDVLKGESVGDSVVIIGGGLVGCETADYLAYHGKVVTIIEMLREIAGDISPASRIFLLRRLADKKIRILTSTIVKAIMDDCLIISSKNGEQTLNSTDTVVLACGAKPINHLESEVQGFVSRTYVVGDAAQPGKLLQATQQAAKIARRL